jgi:c-di-AMP phosphodiesterase-like protein
MVAGATSMTLRCEFKDKGGISILVRDITGKVRFFGGNLQATDDFAKKAAKVADENFSSAAKRS